MNTMIPMQFENANIRVVTDEAGEPWFVGKDVAEALGYANPTDAMNQHCRGVVKRYPIVDALGRNQEARVLSEPDVLRLIVRSTLPGAERFERWVFEDVLPTIRKTGGYGKPSVDPASLTRADILRLALDSEEKRIAAESKVAELAPKVIALEHTVAEQAPKVEALELLTESEGAMCMTDAGKVLGITRDKFIRWLHSLEWIYRRVGKDEWTVHADKERLGYVALKLNPYINGKTGETEYSHNVRITPKGMAKLAILKGAVYGVNNRQSIPHIDTNNYQGAP